MMNRSKSKDGRPFQWLCAACTETVGQIKFRSENHKSAIPAGQRIETGKTETYVTEAVCDEETSRTSALLAALLREMCKA